VKGPRGADPADAAGVAINLTPMIDVVFQLLVFLMIANDVSRREIEDLDLPSAPTATQDEGGERRLIVNLLRSGRDGPPSLRVRGADTDLAGFRQVLKSEADREREDDATRTSRLSVLIRADRDSRWQDVQWVIQACADPDVRVHRLQFATEDPTKSGK